MQKMHEYKTKAWIIDWWCQLVVITDQHARSTAQWIDFQRSEYHHSNALDIPTPFSFENLYHLTIIIHWENLYVQHVILHLQGSFGFGWYHRLLLGFTSEWETERDLPYLVGAVRWISFFVLGYIIAHLQSSDDKHGWNRTHPLYYYRHELVCTC